MSFKTTLALLALLCALGTFYVVFEHDMPSTEESARRSKLLLPGLKPDAYLRIAITHPREPTASAIVLARPTSRDRWRMESPLRVEANQSESDRVLTALQSLEKKGAAPAGDEARLGLEPPRVRVELGEGPGAVVVAFGDTDVSGKSAAAKVAGQPEAAIVPAAEAASFDRRADDFRDRAVFSIDRWSVERIAATLPGSGRPPLALRHVNDQWLLGAGEDDYADRNAADELLAAATDASAKEFVARDVTGTALEPYGLAAPAATIAIESATERQTLDVGAPVPGKPGERYALREDRGEVVAIDGKLVDDLLGLDPEKWRSKLLLAPTRDAPEALEVRAPGAPLPLARLERRGADPWRFTAPVTATADLSSVEDLVRDLQALEIVSVAAARIEDPQNFGLDDRHALLVTLELPKGKESFRLGKPALRSDGYYVRREGKDQAFEVVLPRAAELRHAYPVLRDRALLSVSPADISRIDIARAGGSRPYARSQRDRWSTPAAKANADALERLALELARLRAEKVLVPPADLAPIGLKDPWLRLTVALSAEGGTGPAQEPVKLALGKIVPEGGAFHALYERGGDALVVTLKKDLVDELDKDYVLPPEPPK